MTDKKDACTIRDSAHVEPCDALREICEGQARPGKSKGLYVWPFINLKTRKPSRTIFGIKSSHDPKGTILNFCPWCGVDHRPAIEGEAP